MCLFLCDILISPCTHFSCSYFSMLLFLYVILISPVLISHVFISPCFSFSMLFLSLQIFLISPHSSHFSQQNFSRRMRKEKLKNGRWLSWKRSGKGRRKRQKKGGNWVRIKWVYLWFSWLYVTDSSHDFMWLNHLMTLCDWVISWLYVTDSLHDYMTKSSAYMTEYISVFKYLCWRLLLFSLSMKFVVKIRLFEVILKLGDNFFFYILQVMSQK